MTALEILKLLEEEASKNNGHREVVTAILMFELGVDYDKALEKYEYYSEDLDNFITEELREQD